MWKKRKKKPKWIVNSNDCVCGKSLAESSVNWFIYIMFILCRLSAIYPSFSSSWRGLAPWPNESEFDGSILTDPRHQLANQAADLRDKSSWAPSRAATIWGSNGEEISSVITMLAYWKVSSLKPLGLLTRRHPSQLVGTAFRLSTSCCDTPTNNPFGLVFAARRRAIIVIESGGTDGNAFGAR